MSQDEFFRSITRMLQQAGVPFMVTGSHGSSHHGKPRSTYDLDIVIDPTADQLDAFCALLAGEYYVSVASAHEALGARSMFNVIDLAGGNKADLVIRKDRPFSVEEFARRQASSMHGVPIWVASAEDIILSKLEWNKITPSERQMQDALDVAVVQKACLDEAYLRRWATDLGVSDALHEVLDKVRQMNQTP
jgi:hypothetical protein